MTKRVSNFSAGPAALPLAALERAQAELLNFGGTGMSIIEMSHRGKEYDAVHNEALSLLRELLSVPETHEILFLQGGASHQFAMIPMNFLPQGASADYINTGVWSEKAFAEAHTIGHVKSAFDGTHTNFRHIPTSHELKLDPKAAYVHFTSNNTVYGTQFHSFPNVGDVPLVADMSSDLLWKKIDVSKFALIYAGAQKNIGPSGVTIVIARKDFIAQGRADLPKIFQYRTHAKENSLYNTSPTFSIYLVRNVLAVLKENGGLDVAERNNREKGRVLYDAIDRHAGLYRAPAEHGSRSFMNVLFMLPTEALEKKFLADAASHDLVGLKGHRITGGVRASIYNAVSVADVQKLANFMDDFAKTNG